MDLRTIKDRWLTVLGGLDLLYNGIRVVLEWAGAIDLVVERVEDPSWLTTVFTWLLEPSPLVIWGTIAIGLGLIWFDQRRRQGKGAESTSSLQPAAAPNPSAATTKEHVRWKKHKKRLEDLYDEGQALIEHHWPDPGDKKAQEHYRKWERRTAEYLEKKLGKSYRAQFRGGDFPVKAALIMTLSPARLRNRIDESLDRLSEIIWAQRSPKSPIRAVPRIIGHSYQLQFDNRTGQARIFTAQVSIIKRDAVIRGVSGGKTYGAQWESEKERQAEIGNGSLDYVVLAERHVLGSGDAQEVRFRFPWLKGGGEPLETYTDPWKRGDGSRCRVDLRVTVSAKPAYEGNPYRGCFRLTPTAFQAISC